jgi:hypothetical protein
LDPSPGTYKSAMDASDVPSGVLGPWRTRPWQVALLLRIAELKQRARLRYAGSRDPREAEIRSLAEQHLNQAEELVLARGLAGTITGRSFEAAQLHLYAAEELLIQSLPIDTLRVELPHLAADIRGHLSLTDSRRFEVERIVGRAPAQGLTEPDRATLMAAVRAARDEEIQASFRLRSFRNVLLIATLMVWLFAIGLAALGAAAPNLLPLCFTDEGVTSCPIGAHVSPADTIIIELVGAAGATVGTLLDLRRTRATPSPYGIPLTLATIKIPTGAILAVGGLLLLRGGFVPGVGEFSSTSEVLGAAGVLGYLQRLVTRPIETQAGEVEKTVAGGPHRQTPAGAFDTALPEALSLSVVRAADEVLPTAIRSSLREAVLGPPLANFTGMLDIQTSIGQKAPTRLPESRVVVAPPGSALSLFVTIRRGANPGPRIPLKITGGEEVSTVEFVVTVDTDFDVPLSESETISLEPDTKERRSTFRIPVPESYDEAWLWVRVTQRRRILQSVELQLRPRDEPS